MADRVVQRWVLFAYLSFFTNTLMAAGKLAMGAYTMSLLLCIHALYNGGMALARIVAVRGYKAGRPTPGNSPGNKSERRCFFQVGLILSVTSLVYILYCLRLFFHGSAVRYSPVVSITIAAVTFTEIGLALYGVAATRKYKRPAVTAIKLTNLASSLISLVLTQTAILSFTLEGEASFYNSIAGVVFGGISALIGLGMMCSARRITERRRGAPEDSVFPRAA